jgi:hypothetical protein
MRAEAAGRVIGALLGGLTALAVARRLGVRVRP